MMKSKLRSNTQRKRSSTRTTVQEARVGDDEPRSKKAQTEVEDKSEETQSNKSREKSLDLVWDASGFSMPALEGSTKTVWRIVQQALKEETRFALCV